MIIERTNTEVIVRPPAGIDTPYLEKLADGKKTKK